MYYRNKEKIETIQNIIKPFEIDRNYNKNDKALHADINWNASIFFAKILIKAVIPKNYCSKEDIEKFSKKYKTENNVSIDIDSLFKKFWLREILGIIHIPDAVRKVIYDFERNQSNKEELFFVREVYKTYQTKTIDKTGYQKFIAQYKIDKNVNLDEEWLNSKWIKTNKKSDEAIDIGNIVYYSVLLDNWNEFGFLYKLKKNKLEYTNKGLEVSKNNFNAIHNAHKSYFIKTPSLDDLKEQEVIREIDNKYHIDFYNCKVSYWDTLCDKIGGFVWEDLIADDKIPDDKERVIIFVKKILYWENSWSDFYKHITKESKNRFIKSALELILEEQDIIGVENEFFKCYLDESIGSRHAFQAGIDLVEEALKPSSNYYELYEQMCFLSKKHQGNLFHVQEVRNDLAFLIKTIVCCDTPFSNTESNDSEKNTPYPLIKSLLKNSLSKPYLLWETCHFLVQDKPTIIPYFLEVSEFASMAFNLINKVKIESSIVEFDRAIKLKLIEDSIKLGLDSILSSQKHTNHEIALFIFQCYKEIYKDKYQSLSNIRREEDVYEIREYQKKKEQLLIQTIEDCRVNGFDTYNASSEFLLPKIISELIEIFKNYEEPILYLNGIIQFPILALDGLSWLSKCIIYSKYEKQIQDIEDIREMLSDCFKEIYLNKIEQKSVQKKDYPSNTIIQGLPSWAERNERLNLIDWIYPIALLNDTEKLKELLSPGIKLKKAEDEYDEENRFNASKIRTHLFVLITVLKRITTNKAQYFLIYDKLKDVKISIEQNILDLLKHYAVAGKPSKIDILSSSFEQNMFSSSKEEELLPQIAQAINWFDDKSKVINVLIDTSDLLRLLIILDWVTSEGIKKEIIERIKKAQLIDFFRSQNWIPEIELTLSKLSQYKELIEQTEEALDYWEKNITSKRNEKKYEQASFVVRLMLAYNQKDIQQVNKLDEPLENSFEVRGFKPYHYKQFFIGLIHFEDKPKEAYEIFDRLYNQFKESSSVCINRFAAKINWATKSDDVTTKNKLLKQAIQEWEDASKMLSEQSKESVIDKVWVNKLTVYYHLKNFNEFEQLFLSMPDPYQMMEEAAQMRIELFLDQIKQQEAIYYLNKVKEYHKFSDGSNPDFISELSSLVDDKSNIEILKVSYNEIFSKKPQTLIKIFPEKLNGQVDIGKFITKEFAIATNKALDKILAIDEIKNEDKYNDLVQVCLESRFSVFGWIVKDQTRGAFSGKGLNSGERDIVIQNSNSEAILVCEAFIYRDIRTTQAHLKKIFNYHHQKENLIILIYDLGLPSNFENKWKKYLKNTLPKLSYPKDFGIATSKTKDLTKDFSYNSSAIKIGVTHHGKTTTIHHLMINLKYKV
ncbi:hypothetical protein [Chryseobacterium sp.]|uniref:hypothetical protein n=1 Tax=Chryseobacterium sp. TaxID=1871047 RepID=UPI001B1E5B96|nr:hypothetical protein [Chryseobacterium sp.]MBO9694245.1 hypothetical protein [Chryseobacterium sp.]